MKKPAPEVTRAQEGNMKFKIFSEVIVEGIGKMKHEHIQEFSDNSNVFERVLKYREYMRKTFRRCEFKLIEAKEI